MKKAAKHPVRENGSTTFEALAAIIILCLVLFGMLQIYHWCMTRQFCQYAAFYACKSLALGFKPDLAMRAARVSAIAISGESTGSGDNDEEAAKNYMSYGDGSGVRYEYWHGKTRENSPSLYVQLKYGEPDVHGAKVVMENTPLVAPGVAKLFFIAKPPNPHATVESYNYSKELME